MAAEAYLVNALEGHGGVCVCKWVCCWWFACTGGAVVLVVGVVEVSECRWWVKCVDEAPHVKASANLSDAERLPDPPAVSEQASGLAVLNNLTIETAR